MARSDANAKIIHYPNLKTVLMVEDVLKKADVAMTRAAIKRKLPSKVMHQTLSVILEYLEDSGKIMDGRKGVLWTCNPSPKIERAIRRGREISP